MITGERILEISGNRVPNQAVKGLNINIQLDGVELKDELVHITYVYTADYEDGTGHIKIKGILLAKEEADLAKKIANSWKKDKKVPDDYATMLLSAINYSGTANGTLIARVLGLTAPLIPPKIQLKQAAKK